MGNDLHTRDDDMRRVLVDVIPSYLSQIAEAVTGTEISDVIPDSIGTNS